MPNSNKENLSSYYNNFVRDGQPPYGIQPPGGHWITKKDYPITDGMILKHLDGAYHLGTRAPYIPKYAYVDIDNPEHGETERVIEKLKLQSGQYLEFTSPSHERDGSKHIFFKPRFNDEPVTIYKLLQTLKPLIKNLAELYPQRYRIFRLPFGAGQHLIDNETGEPLTTYKYNQLIDWCEKIDPYDLNIIDSQIELPFKGERIIYSKLDPDCKGYFDNGLQSKSSRHIITMELAKYLYRQNVDSSKANQILKSWIRKSHNGYSDTINRGGLVDDVYTDIDNIVKWTYSKYLNGQYYCDMVNNYEQGISESDLDLIASIFPSDIINQRRMFKLLAYYRPRSIYDWVYIPWSRWFEIADHRSYIKFQDTLIKKGFLQKIDNYQVGIFPKRFKLNHFTKGQSYITHDKRNMTDFNQVLSLKPVDYLKNSLKLNRMTINRIKHTSTSYLQV